MEIKKRQDYITEARKRWKNKRMLILLIGVEIGGGVNVIVQEAAKMQEMGVEVYIYNRICFKESFKTNYPTLKIPIIWGYTQYDFKMYLEEFDVICASLYDTLKYFDFTGPKAAYYVQDFEPYFFKEDSREYREAMDSYTIRPDLIRITKTNWNNQEVIKKCNVSCHVIGPSVDLDSFYVTQKEYNEQIRICAMIRPSTPRRAPKRTMEVLKEIKKIFKENVQITIFGSENNIEEEFYSKEYADFEYSNLGILRHENVAGVLQNQDIFVDFSEFQAMGLTAMEAMACGCAAIIPENGGASDFGQNEHNCLLINTKNAQLCFDALKELIVNNQLRQKLSHNAINDIQNFSVEKSAYKFLEAIFGSEECENKKRESLNRIKYWLPKSFVGLYEEQKKVFIYGAGKYAIKWAGILEITEVSYENFVVSNKDGNPEVLCNHKVISFREMIDLQVNIEKSLLIVGMCRKNAMEVIPKIKQKGISIYYCDFKEVERQKLNGY